MKDLSTCSSSVHVNRALTATTTILQIRTALTSLHTQGVLPKHEQLSGYQYRSLKISFGRIILYGYIHIH